MALPLQQEEEPSQGDLSRPNQTICTQISRIPLPADDCDRIHSMHAALSSLGAATTSFDAAMDSLLAASAHQRRRVQALERRMTAFRACLRRFDRVAAFKTRNDALDEEMLVLLCPGSYESALEGMDLDLAQVRAALDAETVATSTSNATRVAADAAVQTSLARDVRLDNGQAVPSDAWLDRASMGLGVGKALEATNQQRGIPLLLGETVRKGEIEYQHVLDTLVQHAAATHQDGFDRLEHLEESPGGDYRGDDESVYSVTSHMSTISVASSTRMTAGQRRRWHKQQSMKGRTKASATQMHPTLSTHVEASSQESAMAGRQQSLVGSECARSLCALYPTVVPCLRVRRLPRLPRPRSRSSLPVRSVPRLVRHRSRARPGPGGLLGIFGPQHQGRGDRILSPLQSHHRPASVQHHQEQLRPGESTHGGAKAEGRWTRNRGDSDCDRTSPFADVRDQRNTFGKVGL